MTLFGELKKSNAMYDQGRWRPEVLQRSERLNADSKKQAKLKLGEEEIEIIHKVRKSVNVFQKTFNNLLPGCAARHYPRQPFSTIIFDNHSRQPFSITILDNYPRQPFSTIILDNRSRQPRPGMLYRW